MSERRQKGSDWRAGIRDGFTESGDVRCEECFKSKLELEKLRLENKRLKENISRLEGRQAYSQNQGFAGAHTPSSKIPFKEKALEEDIAKKGGAKLGHRGYGRRKLKIEQADRIIRIEPPSLCPNCQARLKRDGIRRRTVLEAFEIKIQKTIYECARGKCPSCNKVHTGAMPILPKSLYGNGLLATMAVMHYVHGITLGRICEILGPQIHI